MVLRSVGIVVGIPVFCVMTMCWAFALMALGLAFVVRLSVADDYAGWRREHPVSKLVFGDDFRGEARWKEVEPQ